MSTKKACITLDMERDHGDPTGHIRLLENPQLLDKYCSIINQNSIKVTIFVVTSLFDQYGQQLKELGKRIPVEFAVHSHSHDPANACTLFEVEKSFQEFTQFMGSPPLGYRAPYGQLGKENYSDLIEVGYKYDASIYTSFRPGKFGYNNLKLPNIPFKVTSENGSIIEFPFTSLSKIRIVFAISYVKLLGWLPYSTLMRLFPLPDVVVALTHPYDYYFHLVSDGIKGIEKIALLRNAKKAFPIFEKMIKLLKKQDYEFVFMSDLYHDQKDKGDLEIISVEEWK